jgi:hypothetical protein
MLTFINLKSLTIPIDSMKSESSPYNSQIEKYEIEGISVAGDTVSVNLKFWLAGDKSKTYHSLKTSTHIKTSPHSIATTLARQLRENYEWVKMNVGEESKRIEDILRSKWEKCVSELQNPWEIPSL